MHSGYRNAPTSRMARVKKWVNELNSEVPSDWRDPLLTPAQEPPRASCLGRLESNNSLGWLTKGAKANRELANRLAEREVSLRDLGPHRTNCSNGRHGIIGPRRS